MHYVEVAPTTIIRANTSHYTYHCDTALQVGQIVIVPVGKSSRVGVIMKVVAKPTYETRSIIEVLEIPPLPAPLLQTAKWLSDYYHSHLALVLQSILPSHLTKKRRKVHMVNTEEIAERTTFVLNNSQRQAVKRIETAGTETLLLHGITGSGKTRVYIETVRTHIKNGRSAIVLVPEISLTSQLYQEFSREFPDSILTHSRQTEAERHSAWLEALRSQSPRVVIGPRSALFMPLNNIGIVIVDESHEPSYKQEKSPRYSALRTARILADQHHARLVLGSATPRIEDYYVAKKADNAIITMATLAQKNAKKPSVAVIDMMKRTHFTRHHFLSDPLIAAIEHTIAENSQVLIFHNRRGSASITLCESCGWQAGCPRCFVPLTLHADNYTLLCHICGTQTRVPTSCPECNTANIIHKGIGTKTIEAALNKIFPDATIARFDGDNPTDTTLDKRYNELRDGSIDIIIGTQVVAKGLDLPHLRTVGVVQADSGLQLPDYTATERTFQLLSQAIGRVGRTHHESNVIVQTYQPQHPAIIDATTQNYAEFYQRTIALRRHTNFPPFCYLLKAVCSYKTEKAAIKNAQDVAKKLQSIEPNVEVLGPTPAFYERQRDTYRWQITVKSPSRRALLALIDHIPASHWQYELDPASLL